MGFETTYAYSENNYSATGGTTTITDPNGNVTRDAFVNGLLQSATTGYGTTGAATTRYAYDPTSLGVTQTTDAMGNVSTATYDAKSNVLTSTNALNQTTSYAYNALSEVTCKALPMASAPCSSLSPPGAIPAGSATITPPSSPPSPYVTYSEYDTNGNLIDATTGVYPPGSDTPTTVRTTYDLYNGQSLTLGTVTDSCQSTAPSSSLPGATIDPNGVLTQLAYDAYGDLISRSTPNESAAQYPGQISTFAGGPMGAEPATSLYQGNNQIAPYTTGGVTYLYLADAAENVIRRLDASTGQETVVVGNYAAGGYGDGLPATTAQLNGPEGVAVDGSGDLAIADTNDNEVRFVPATSGTYFGRAMTAGDIYDIAGTGSWGGSGDGGPGPSATLSGPSAVAFDAGGVVIADPGNNEVRFVPTTSGTYFGQAMTAGDIYAIAGNGTTGSSGNGGAATSAELNTPSGVAVDANGDVAIADTLNSEIRFLPATSGTYFGQAMTAGDLYDVAGDGTAGYSGDGGVATAGEINQPDGVAFDAAGNLLIADSSNWVVRVVANVAGTYYGGSMAAGELHSVVGSGNWGDASSATPAGSANLSQVIGVAGDASGDVFLTYRYDHETRVVPAASGTFFGVPMTGGDLYDVAGTGANSAQNYTGSASGAEFNEPSGVRTDSSGDLYIADTSDNAIRFIPKSSGTYYGQTMTGGNTYDILGDGYWGYSGDGGPATSAEITWPDGVGVDASGDVAAVDNYHNVVRFMPATSGTYFGQTMTADDVYTVAGDQSKAYSGDGGPATAAALDSPQFASFDASGNLLIGDSGNNVIRVVANSSGTFYGQAMTAGDVYTVAGNGTGGYSGDGGPATSAELNAPGDVTATASGGLLIADAGNGAVRFVPETSGTYFNQAMTAGDIYTVAGTGTSGYSGDGGPATSAEFSNTQDALLDAPGNLYVLDTGNDVVRFVPAASGEYYGQAMTAGDVYTIGGVGWGEIHFQGDGGPPRDAEFGWILGMALDGAGGYYLSDYVDGRIRYVSDAAPTSLSTTTSTYNLDGEVTSVTSPNGNLPGANAGNDTTAYTYDLDGRVLTMTQAGGSGATVTPRTTTYTYDGDGNRVTTTDARGYTSHDAYNADDELTLSTNPLGNATLTCYDGNGNVVETVPAVGVAASSLTPSNCATPGSFPLASDATTTTYNALNEPTVVSTPAPPGLAGFETTTSAYNLDGWLTSVTAPPTSTLGGSSPDVTTYTYDAAGELLTTTTGSSSPTAATTSSCYDPNGDRTASVPGDGNTSGVVPCASSAPYETTSPYQTGYTYDSAGELLTQTTPATPAAPSGALTTYAYDPAGNEVTSTNPDGVTSTMTYTPLDELASTSYSDATPNVTRTYDANGQLLTMVDGSGTTSDVYDPFGELVTETNGDGATVSYAYDADGDTTSVTYPLAGASWASTDAITYGYDSADQMSSITTFTGRTSTVTVSPDGLPTAVTLGTSGDTVSTTYAANDAVASIALTNSPSTLQSFTYADGPAGNVLSETDTPSSAGSPNSYTYDAQSRVTSDAKGSSGTSTYGEDASSNLTTLPTGASATYNDASELASSTLSGATTTYGYDAAGNLTGESVGGSATTTATYNGANELTTYSDAAANMTSASYNGNGLRMTASITPSGGSADVDHYVWDTATSVPQVLMDSSNAYVYGPTGALFEDWNLSSGAVTFFVTDALGSVRGAVGVGGNLEATATYDAWGNVVGTSGVSSYSQLGFDGSLTDETGLTYFVHRYYSAPTGRFLSVDPLVSVTGQPYSFVGDNPVVQTDPLGQSIFDGNLMNTGNEEVIGSVTPGEVVPAANVTSPVDESKGRTGGEVPKGTPTGGDTATASSIQEALSKLPKGLNDGVRVAPSETAFLDFFDLATRGGEIVADEGVAGRGILRYELPDGTTVQLREYSSGGSATIDISFPTSRGSTIEKVHL